jgi:hypothetical protein
VGGGGERREKRIRREATTKQRVDFVVLTCKKGRAHQRYKI